MSDVHEVCAVHLTDHQGDPVDYGLRCTAVRTEGSVFWRLFFSGIGEDSWINMMDMTEVPSVWTIFPSEARYIANLALAFGDPWDEVWRDPAMVADRQDILLGQMSSKAATRLRSADPHMTWAGREEFHRMEFTQGELLRAKLTNIDPKAARN